MSIQLIANHVLIPNPPDWNDGVRFERAWQSQVDRAVTGHETRRALRPKFRARLEFQVSAHTHDEQAMLQARLWRALKNALACAPSWGQGIPIQSAAGNEIVLARAAWPDTAPDDWVFVSTPTGEAFEVGEVESADEATITLKAPLTGTWGTGALAWPVVFGFFELLSLTHHLDQSFSARIRLRQLATRPKPVVLVDVTFTFSLAGEPLRDTGQIMSFKHTLNNEPLIERQQ